jgi:single-strand DNA-binding protein
MNVCILDGHVGREPKVRSFPNSDRVAEFSLATNESWRDRTTGEKKVKTDWHRIAVYSSGDSRLVDRVEKYITKGTRVRIMGRASTRNIITSKGEKVPLTYFEVRRADGIELITPARAHADTSLAEATPAVVSETAVAVVPPVDLAPPVPAVAPSPAAPVAIAPSAPPAASPQPIATPPVEKPAAAPPADDVFAGADGEDFPFSEDDLLNEAGFSLE